MMHRLWPASQTVEMVKEFPSGEKHAHCTISLDDYYKVLLEIKDGIPH